MTEETTIKKSMFTLGPLTANGNGVHKGTRCVAITFDPDGRDMDVIQANARLFAAAPALYEALRVLLKTETNLGGVSAIELLDAVDQARAALALVDTNTTEEVE